MKASTSYELCQENVFNYFMERYQSDIDQTVEGISRVPEVYASYVRICSCITTIFADFFARISPKHLIVFDKFDTT